MDGWMGGWVDGWMGGWVDEWVDEWMGRWVDEWMGCSFAAEPQQDSLDKTYNLLKKNPEKAVSKCKEYYARFSIL